MWGEIYLQVIRARSGGVCFGVKRALAAAEQAAEQFGEVYSLGPLIHNPQEVDRLEKHGIKWSEKIQDIQGAQMIIRSHGVAPELFTMADQRGITIIDATCPFVKRAQDFARELVDEGYQLVVVGDQFHPEVQGIVGWSRRQALVVENAQEALRLPSADKMAVIAQTTQSNHNFQQVVDVLRLKTGQLKIHNTICHATRERQEEAARLAEQVSVMLVVGGLNSANTRKLAQICAENGAVTYHIEKAEQICRDWFFGVERVGLTAGASTPEWIIEEVLQAMMEINEQDQNKTVDETSPEEQLPVQEDLPVEQGAEETPTASEQEATAAEAPAAGEENMTEETASEESAYEEEAGEETSFQEAYERGIKEVRRGERMIGTVVEIHDGEVLVDVGGKSEGVIFRSELSAYEAENIREAIKVGDKIEVLVMKRENEEGHPILSKKRVDQEVMWDKMQQAFDSGETITAKVAEVVKGGLLVDSGVRGFIPASLIDLGFVEDLSVYVGKELPMKVIECDRTHNKLVFSPKAVLEAEQQKKKVSTWADLAEGQTIQGTVRRLTSFGAFVDIGGIDGLLHVSEMAWYRVEHPSDILKEGDVMDVFILGADREKEKVSLGLKQLMPNPWTTAVERYPVGDVVKAKIVRTAPFGAFAQVEPGIEGLVHISQLALERVAKTEDVVKPGDEVNVKILSVDPVAKRMSLSIRETLESAPVETAVEIEAAETVEALEESGLEVSIGDMLDSLKEV